MLKVENGPIYVGCASPFDANIKKEVLLSVTTAPSGTFVEGSKYYNSTTKKIYTAINDSTWVGAKESDPAFGTYYIYNEQAYVWDGNSLELFELEDYQKKLTATNHIKIENNVIGQDGADLSNVLPTLNSAVIKTPVGLGEDTIAYYKLDGNLDNSVTDSSIQIDVFDPSWEEGSYSFVSGKFNNCISVPNNNIIEFGNVFTDLSSYTIDFWVKFSASGANYTQYKLDLYNTSASAQCMLIINYYLNGNNPMLQIYLQKGQTLQKWIYNGSAEGIIDNGRWSHIGIMVQDADTSNVTFKVGVVTPSLNFEEIVLGYNIINSGDLSTLDILDIYGKDLTSDSYLIDEFHIQIGYFVPWYKMKSQYSDVWDGTYQVYIFGFANAQDLQNYVTINSQQSIIGTKTFYNGTNLHGGNDTARLRKYSQLTNGQISQDIALAYSNASWILKSGIVTSIDSTNNTSTLSLVAGPDDQHQAGIEITGDVNGKANLTLTNPDIAVSDDSNKVATTAWVKDKLQAVITIDANNVVTIDLGD